MARYIDADNFRKAMIKRFGCIPCLTDYSEASRYDIPIDDALNLVPTADVVPKSEYDAVVSAVDNSTKEFLKLHDDYQKAKSEVEKLVQDGTRLVQENETLKDNNEHLAVILEETKAEVERLQNELVIWKQNRFNLFQRLECYEMARQKVASEIFTDIEKEIDTGISVIEKILKTKGGRANGKTVLISKYDVYIEAKKHLAELKKKYEVETK